VESSKNSKLDQKYVLITGNGLFDDHDRADQMEVMNKDGTAKICNANYKYPVNVLDATGALVSGKMVVCGGGYPVTSTCYVFGGDNTWKLLADMAAPRVSSRSLAFPNGAIWVTGGSDNSFNTHKTTEMIYLDGTVKPGPELPEPLEGHCLVQYEGTIFLLNGRNVWQNNNELDINNLDNIEWTAGPSMNKERDNLGCGIVQSNYHGGRPLLVAAGGSGDSSSKKTSEYLDFTIEGSQWQLLSRELPKRQYGYGEYVKYSPIIIPTTDGKGLLMSYYKDVYKWQCESAESCFWTYEESYKPEIARKGIVFLSVPSSLVEDC